MTLFVSPHKDVRLKGWSLLPGEPLKGPQWNKRDTYFVYYSYGSDPQPWNFWIDLQVLRFVCSVFTFSQVVLLLLLGKHNFYLC